MPLVQLQDRVQHVAICKAKLWISFTLNDTQLFTHFCRCFGLGHAQIILEFRIVFDFFCLHKAKMCFMLFHILVLQLEPLLVVTFLVVFSFSEDFNTSSRLFILMSHTSNKIVCESICLHLPNDFTQFFLLFS